MARKLKMTAALLACTAMVGCANIPKATQVGATSINYNKEVAQVKDELLLLNIARASLSQPMHFTRILNIKNTTKLMGSAEIGGTYPDRGRSYSNTTGVGDAPTSFVENVSSAAKTLTPNISGSYTITPVIDYEIQDSKEFYNGILSQIDEDLFAHYLDQGWPDKLLAMLLIKRITISGEEFKNDPNDKDQINKFRSLINCAKFITDPVSASSVSYEILPLKSATHALADNPDKNDGSTSQDSKNSKLALTAKELQKVSETLAQKGWSSKTSGELTFSKGGGHQVKIDISKCKTIKFKKLNQKADDNESESEFQIPSDYDAVSYGLFESVHNVDDLKDEGSQKIEGTMRSIQGVMFYLGECLRVRSNNCYYDSEDGLTYVSKIQRASWKNSEGVERYERILSVRLEGEEFFVPKIETDNGPIADRTLMTLSLVNQLFSLQQEAKEAPTTGTFLSLN